MSKLTGDRIGVIIRLLTLVSVAGAATPSDAREFRKDDMPCNAFCRTWMGYDKRDNGTGLIVENIEPETRPAIRRDRSIASKPSPQINRLKVEALKTARVARPDGHPVAETPRTAVASRQTRSETREDRGNKPFPVPRPAIPGDPSVMVDRAAPPATPASSRPPHKVVEAAIVPAAGTERVAPIHQTSPSSPDRSTARDTREPRSEPSQDVRPAAAAAPSSTGSSSRPTPRIATIAPVAEVTKPPVNTDVVATPPATGEAVGRPGAQSPLDPTPAARPPSSVVASLPSPADEKSSLQNDADPSVGIQEDRLQPTPERAGNTLHITIGQISVEQRGTDIHVVVVNVLQSEMKDVGVRCRARDVRGLQVAEASARIASIAPSDVAFGQVLFPPEITTRDNRFTCDIESIAATKDAVP